MNKIKYLTYVIMVFLLFSLQAASLTTVSSNTKQTMITKDAVDAKIAIVYSTGGLGDLSFNDAAKRGIESAKVIATAGGKSIQVDEACASQCTIPDITTNIETFAADTNAYDLIIGIGFSAGDGINASALKHTDRKFMIIDSVVDLTNVRSITFKEHEGSFLVGAMAAMVSKTNDIAFLGGLDIPLINRFLAGYEHGARTITPDIIVRATYSPDPTNPWGDLEGGKTIGEQFFKKGSDVVYAAAGGTGIGVINAAKERNAAGGDKVYAIGVDSDQDYVSEGDVLASMIKKVDVAVENQVVAATWGNWTAGVEDRGIKEDGVGISPMNFTQTEAKAIYTGTQTRAEKVQELSDSIVKGDITVRSTLDNADVDFGEEEEAPILIAPIFFAVFMMALVIRRRRKL